MTVYRYGLVLRPPALGAIPKAGLLEVGYESLQFAGRRLWGWAEYGRELTKKEVEDYELVFMYKGDKA